MLDRLKGESIYFQREGKKVKEIILKFDPTVSRLSGATFGELIFVKQVKNNLETNKSNTIVFPLTVESISKSFAQGFLEDMPAGHKIQGNHKIMSKINEVITENKFKRFEPE